jgi:putative adhesin
MPSTDDHPASLDVSLARGSLRVTVKDVPEITLEVVDGPRNELRIERSSDGRQVVVEYPHRGFGFGRHPRFDLAATVPMGTELRAATASASVTTTGPLGAVEITTASGGVRLDEVRGRADVTTASGGLEVHHVGGALSFRTASGSIEVERSAWPVAT